MVRSLRLSPRLWLILSIGVLVFSACTAAGEETAAPAVASPTPASAAQEDPTAEEAPTASLPEATLPGATSAAEPTAAPTEPAPPTPTASEISSESVAELPDPGGFAWGLFASGFRRPVDLADFGDGSGRLLVVEQGGVITIVQNGSTLPDPFLDISSRVTREGNEQGLLGIALHPDFQNNRFFYLNYTGLNGDTVIARYEATADNPNRADPNSEKVLFTVEQPYANHNGGVLAFGPDGYLYIGLGDGGSAGDPQGNGQSLDTLLGKILRIDVDNGDPYAIPADNPYVNGGGRPEIWAYGLRNPWRFSFDLATGDLYIGDVGQGEWEEIDFLPAGSPGGANFGWNYREGAHDYQGASSAGLTLQEPVAEYSHSQGCSVTGGFVYRGGELAEFQGVYLYTDYCSGKMWSLLRAGDTWQTRELFQTGMTITSYGQDRSGALYVLDQTSGSVYRLERSS